MLYVQQSLGPDEELVHVGKFHWMYTVSAFFAIFWGLVGSVFVIVMASYVYHMWGMAPANTSFWATIPYIHPLIRIFAFFVFVFGLLKFAVMMVNKATTEIAITNNRIVFKKGLVARQVGEINIDRIEGVNVIQSVLGRIFNYGRVIVRGMGIGEVFLPTMEDPIAFRRAIEKARTL